MKRLTQALFATALSVATPLSAETVQSLKAQNEALQSRIDALEEIIRKDPELQSQLSSVPSAGPVIIARGDTLFSIARKYGTTPDALMKENGIKDPSSIPVGTMLTIPGSKMKATVSRTQAEPRGGQLEQGQTYTVVKGDTLYGISRRSGIPLARLEAANPSVSAKNLRAGMKLKLIGADPKPAADPPKTSKPKASPQKQTESKPRPKPKTESKPKPTPKPESKPKPKTQSKPKPEPTPPPVAQKKDEDLPQPKFEEKEASIKSVLITTETTYGEFAAKHGTTTSELNTLNGLKLVKGTLLAKGSELYVPGR